MATDKRLVSLETRSRRWRTRRGCGSSACLRAGEICVCDIHGSLALPQPTVSRHLAYLRKTGLVETRKDGLWVHYRLANLPDPVMQTLLDAVTHAIGHAESGDRDRKRLAKTAPLHSCRAGTRRPLLLLTRTLHAGTGTTHGTFPPKRAPTQRAKADDLTRI